MNEEELLALLNGDDFDASTLEHRDAVSAHNAGLARLAVLIPNGEERSLSGDEETEADRLIERVEILSRSLDESERGQRREQRSARVAALSQRTAPTDPVPSVPRGPESRSTDDDDPVHNTDGSKYSLCRAIERRSGGQPLDGYELEVSQEIEHRTGKRAGGFFLPPGLPMGRVESRSGQTKADVATTIQDRVDGSRFIEVLENRLSVSQMGADVITGLSGDLSIPSEDNSFTFNVIGEDDEGPTQGITTGEVTFTPRTGNVSTYFTRKMLLQASSMEGRVRRKLLNAQALGLDSQVLNGDGVGNNCLGLLQDPEITIVEIGTNGGLPTWSMVVKLETAVAAANADMGTLGYITSAKGRGIMKETQRFDGTDGHPIWKDDGTLNEYQAIATNQVPSDLTKGTGTNLTALLFGNFADAVIAMWSAVDVMVDPYSSSSKGGVHVHTFQDFDFKKSRAASFAKCLDIETE